MFNLFKRTTTAFAFLSLAFCYASMAQDVTFDWATVGNPGNEGDVQFNGTFGGVDYNYRISKHEVTNTQYTEFLNAVADADPNGLYNAEMGSDTRGGITRTGSSPNYMYAIKPDSAGNGPGGTDYTYGNKPVVFVSYLDAMRFTNWLENGQPTGAQDASTTENGVYAISDGVSETRNPGATYFIPSGDEWYKAAYHDTSAGTAGVYFDYPTGTDTPPNSNLPSADTGNSANFALATGDSNYPMTDVGDYNLSESPYGTFDQGGNVWEWNETFTSPYWWDFRGGDWGSIDGFLAAYFRSIGTPSYENYTVGFRVTSIPEPSTLLLGAMATVGLLMRRRSLR